MDSIPTIAPPYEVSEKLAKFGFLYGPCVFSLVYCQCDNGSHCQWLGRHYRCLDLVQTNYFGRCPAWQWMDESE